MNALFARSMCTAVFAAAVLVMSPPLSAQSGKTIRVVVPFGPGGAQDILARSFSTELGAALGEIVIVEYKPGAGGAVGSAFVGNAEPDGRTLLMAANGHTIAALISPKPPYDPVKDFTAVAHVGTGYQVLMSGRHVPARTLDEFVAHAKAHPGKLNFGSAGVGSSTHLGAVYFAMKAGIDLAHIPYKSNADQINELLGGRIELIAVPVASGGQYVNDERVRIIGTTGPARTTLMPGIQTVAESFAGYRYGSWFGLIGPAGVPRATVDRINAAMNRILQSPVMTERLTKLGLDSESMSPDAFARVMGADRESIAEMIRAAGITR